MRISDWSSDVCSSDLRLAGRRPATLGPAALRLATPTPDAFAPGREELLALQAVEIDQQARAELDRPTGADAVLADPDPAVGAGQPGSHGQEPAFVRADERRVGKEGVRPCRSRWAPSH